MAVGTIVGTSPFPMVDGGTIGSSRRESIAWSN